MSNNQAEISVSPIWVDVTTLIHWNRPAVGIIRVEQQFCLWLLQQKEGGVCFCRYDRTRKQFFNVDRKTVSAHLERIDTYTQLNDRALASPVDFEGRLRNRAIRSLERLPLRFRGPALRALVKLRPRVLDLIHRTRNLRATLKLKQSRTSMPVTGPSLPLDMSAGSVYVSLGLDWEYKDMAHLYKLKKEKGLKYLFFCYDIIPILQPHLCVGDVSRQFAHYFADLAWGADLILSISESSRHDLGVILGRLNVPSPENKVIHLGSDILPVEKNEVTISDSVAKLLTRRYLLFVSTIERRKNHEILYRAYVRLAEEGFELPALVFVGMTGWGVQELLSDIRLDPRVQERIHILNHVSDTELASLYRHAAFTVYPSLYEGWGLPVAESLAFGKFCLCSNSSSLPEVGGSWVEYLDPWDLPAWVNSLRHYLTHPEEVERLNANIAANYRPHAWRETSATIHSHAVGLQRKP